MSYIFCAAMSAVSFAAFLIARPKVARSKRVSSFYSRSRLLSYLTWNQSFILTENSGASTSDWCSEGIGVAETKMAERRDATARVVANFILCEGYRYGVSGDLQK